MKKPLVFFIVGPTASGKTDAAVYAAKKLGGEIISADSIQIYRGMDIGTAKPDEAEKGGVPHHMIDVVDYLDESYNAARFASDASALISKITERGMAPVIAGGTGLYVNSLLYPLDFTSVKPDEELRAKLGKEEEEEPGTLYKRLSENDPAAAGRINRGDIKRIIRALEILEVTGKTMTEQGGDFLNSRGEEIPFEPVIAGINMDRTVLYDRINRRVDKMIERDLCDEARRLYEEAGKRRVLSLQGIGYKQFISYFEGECTFDEAVELIKRDTRRYAKRQIAWFKRDKRIRWFDRGEYASSEELNKAVADYFIGERVKHGGQQ
ncbi:MAG: tRNA (adenosine(37)-N6)-dimethylallyltransferase MiaA [Clostridiales bacterium]|nr:tRNA (adenosine(37)-N6)-dimethylallyltransferase MiaA [Clostridiales bacterium]